MLSYGDRYVEPLPELPVFVDVAWMLAMAVD